MYKLTLIFTLIANFSVLASSNDYENWRQDYDVTSQRHLFIHQWKNPDNPSTTPQKVLESLPDSALPLLPEGYIWSRNSSNVLSILEHKYAPKHRLKIYVFGPGKKNCIQYLLVDNNVTVQGLSMPVEVYFHDDKLRETYPMPVGDYVTRAPNPVTYVQGHIIDFRHTQGKPDDPTISTVLVANYKPEPDGGWGRNIRNYILERFFYYSEYMIYGYHPESVSGGAPIPEAVYLQAYTSHGGPDHGYLVQKNSKAHEFDLGGKSCENWMKELRKDIQISPIVIQETGTLATQKARLAGFAQAKAINPTHLSLIEGFTLRLAAETTTDSAISLLDYFIYSAAQKAPQDVRVFWLGRAARLAYRIDEAHVSNLPAFKLDQMNSVVSVVNSSDPQERHFFQILKNISENILFGHFRLDNLFDSVIFDEPDPVVSDSEHSIDLTPMKKTHVRGVTPEIEACDKVNLEVVLVNVSPKAGKDIVEECEKKKIPTPVKIKAQSEFAAKTLRKDLKKKHPGIIIDSKTK